MTFQQEQEQEHKHEYRYEMEDDPHDEDSPWSSEWDYQSDYDHDHKEEEKTPVIEISAPRNPTLSTCYIDSILIALFGSSDDDIEERMTVSVRDTTDTNRLTRTLLRIFQRSLWGTTLADTTTIVKHIQGQITLASTSDRFTSTQHQDAGQCLMTLLGVISCDTGLSVTNVLVTGYSSLRPLEAGFVTSRRAESTGYLHTIDIDDATICTGTIDMLSSTTVVSLEAPGYCHRTGISQQWFDRKVESRQFVPLGSFAIAVARVKMDWARDVHVLDSSPIMLDEFVVSDDEQYMLTACVLYHRRHYTCVFQHAGKWFLYNDLVDQGQPAFVGHTWREACVAVDAATRATIICYQVL
jgi:hypothetical protein